MFVKRFESPAKRGRGRCKRSAVPSLAPRRTDPSRRAVYQRKTGGSPEPEPLPYWQVNVPREDREEACPEYLQNLSDKDVAIIGTRDENFHAQSWDRVADIVRSGRLQEFRRWPSDLRRYREFVWRVKRDKGSVLEYMLTERLHWTQPVVPRSRTPFQCEDDFKILFNDWPYGIDSRIVHLVVWTKFDLEDTAETEAEIEQFIGRVFLPEVAKDKVSGPSSTWERGPPD